MPGDLGALFERIQAVQDDMTSMKRSLSEMAAALLKVAVFEERQANATQALDRAFSEIAALKAKVERIEVERASAAAIAAADRVTANGTTKWVDRAVWGIVVLAIYSALRFVKLAP